MRRDISRKNNKSNLGRLVCYIVDSNPNGVRKLAYSFGYPNFTSREGALRFVSTFLKKEGEKGFDELILQHPDRDVILEVFNSKFPKKVAFSSNFTNDEHSEFTQREDEQLSFIAAYMVKHSKQVVSMLAQYGVYVRNQEDLKEISDKVMDLYNTNTSFREHFANQIANTAASESEFIPQMITAVAGLGSSVIGIAGAKGKRDGEAADRLHQMTMSMMSGKQQKQADKAKNTKIIVIASSVVGALLVLGIVAYFLLRKK